MRTRLIELIRTERRVGFHDNDMVVHRHIQLFTPDGELVVELCAYDGCDTVEPQEGRV